MSFSTAILLLFLATTRSLFPSLPPTVSPTPTTDPWTDESGNPVVSWHKFCNLQNKTFFVLSLPHPRVSAIHSSAGQQSWKNLDSSTVLFACLLSPLPPSPHLKPPPTHPLLPPKVGPFLSISKPSTRKYTGKRLPSGLDSSSGGVGVGGARVESLL